MVASVSGVIYLRHGDRLVPMSEAPYDSEGVLQGLLEDYPDLLAGEQMNVGAPRRWLLVRREAGVPSSDGGYDRWSADHLYLDQDGIPTIIEVKRSTDTRIRREVVGQMLDYAANAIMHWSSANLRLWFEQGCAARGMEAVTEIAETLGYEGDAEQFWEMVDANVRARRVRLVFVVDVIPAELRRIVEFLNEEMRTVEVLAVEVKQYVGQSQQAFVPRVIGHTQTAITRKAGDGRARSWRSWSRAAFLEAVQSSHPEELEGVTALLAWAEQKALPVGWGSGKFGSFFPRIDPQDKSIWLFSVQRNESGNAQLVFELWRIEKKPPFDGVAGRQVLLERLGVALGTTVDDGAIFQYPIAPLREHALMEQILGWCDWVLERVRRAEMTTDE